MKIPKEIEEKILEYQKLYSFHELNPLIYSFYWSETKEGAYFWRDIRDGYYPLFYIYYKILPEKWKIKRSENSDEINQILSSLRKEPYYAGKNDYIYFNKDVFAFTRTIDNNDEYLELTLSNLKEILC